MERSSASVTWPASVAPSPKANLEALRILMASRRPTFICPSSNAVSVPARPLAAQYRTESDPYCSSRPRGVTTLPLDFDIFLRSGSRIHPDSAALYQGTD